MKKILTILSSISLTTFTTASVISCTGVENKVNYSGDYLEELLQIDEKTLESIEKTSELVTLIQTKIENDDSELLPDNIKKEYEIIVVDQSNSTVSTEDYDKSNERRYVKVYYKEVLKIDGKDDTEIESENASFALINK